jgi:hypothetical protein
MATAISERYAVGVRDKGELFLMFEIVRSTSGDVYVNFNERNPGDRLHSSYHASGQLHLKGNGRYRFPVRKRQAPSAEFTGAETIIATAIRRGDGAAWGVKLNSADYLDLMEIDDEIITPEFGYQFSIELAEPEATPWVSTYPYARVVQQRIFKGGIPWIVASLYEMSLEPFPKP